MSQFSDLKQVVGSFETITLDMGGNKVDFKVYELQLNHIVSLMSKFDELKGLADTQSGDYGQTILNNLDTFYEVVGFATMSPKEDIKGAVEGNLITTENFLDLATKVIEVNASVFLRLVQKFSEKMKVLEKAVKKK